jgi:thiol:disulfide interchange protein
MSRSLARLALLLALASCSKQPPASGEAEAPSSIGSQESSAPGGPEAAEATEATKTAGPSGVGWIRDLKEAQAIASKQERDLFIDFSAEWCAPCKELEETTFADPQMAKVLREGYVPVSLDVSEQSDSDLALMGRYEVKVLPALLVVRDEEVLLRIRNYIGPRELEAKLAELSPRPN